MQRRSSIIKKRKRDRIDKAVILEYLKEKLPPEMYDQVTPHLRGPNDTHTPFFNVIKKYLQGKNENDERSIDDEITLFECVAPICFYSTRLAEA